MNCVFSFCVARHRSWVDHPPRRAALGLVVGLSLGLGLAVGVGAQERAVFKCPGNLYTDSISAKEAASRGCRTLEGAPITVIQSSPVRPRAGVGAGASTSASGASSVERISGESQRARDADARRILESELSREEEALAELKKAFNNGEPERQGGERNYQRYLDRVESMRQDIARKEADVAAIRRELGKLSAPPSSPVNGAGRSPN